MSEDRKDDSQSIDKFYRDVGRDAHRRVEKLSGIEKKALRQHILLSRMTNINWKLADNIDAIIIGTSDAAEKVHRAFILGRQLKERQGEYPAFIFSAAIGIVVHESERSGIPGVNAPVMAEQLRQYSEEQVKKFGEDFRIPEDKIIVESESKHTQTQAKEIGKIVKKKGFKSLVNVVGFWHSPRFYMTFINQNPELDLYTSVVSRDTYRIGRAPYGLTGYPFEAPIQIAEVARLHQYVEKDIGPTDPDGLMKYLERLLTNHPKRLESARGAYEKVKPLWEETHQELTSDKFLKLR